MKTPTTGILSTSTGAWPTTHEYAHSRLIILYLKEEYFVLRCATNINVMRYDMACVVCVCVCVW